MAKRRNLFPITFPFRRRRGSHVCLTVEAFPSSNCYLINSRPHSSTNVNVHTDKTLDMKHDIIAIMYLVNVVHCVLV